MSKTPQLTPLEFVALAAILLLVVLPLVASVSGLLFMLAWNFSASPLFGLPQATFIQGIAGWFLVMAVGGAFRSVSSQKN